MFIGLICSSLLIESNKKKNHIKNKGYGFSVFSRQVIRLEDPNVSNALSEHTKIKNL